MTSAYGVGDPTITRRRVEADLAVFHEYRLKYEGMLQVCTQQLAWGVERYVKLPQPPEFLKLEEVPSFWKWSGIWLIAAICYSLWIGWGNLASLSNKIAPLEKPVEFILILILLSPLFGCCVGAIYLGPVLHFRTKAANGDKPLENARRQKAYEEAKAAALKAAERSKAAEDHRLRVQIRELEGLAKTVGEREADVRRILATL